MTEPTENWSYYPYEWTQYYGPFELRSVNDVDRTVFGANKDRNEWQICVVFDDNTAVIRP